MRKFLIRAIPIFALAFFVLVMLSNSFLKGPITKDDDIKESIEKVIDNVKEGQWEEADRNTDSLSKAWKKVAHRVQFSAEKDEIEDFTTCIARLRGAIQMQDKSNAIIELYEAYEHWVDIGK